ncbi:MAG: hypothetical protein R2912_05160 [Eubacteriales bacterium]
MPIPMISFRLEPPMSDDFSPTDDGSSCLARAKDWLHTTCPKCGGEATREADTMPNWAGSTGISCVTDAHNDKEFASREAGLLDAGRLV